MIPSHPLNKLGGQREIVVSDFLDAKGEAIVHEPAVALKAIALLTSVPEIHVQVRKLTHPHHA